MRPRHFWYLFEIEKPKAQRNQPGKLSSAEVARFKRLIED